MVFKTIHCKYKEYIFFSLFVLVSLDKEGEDDF